MRILLAINNLGTGGAETFFCQQARALAEKGHKVFIWQVFYPIFNHQYQEVLNHKNISNFEFSKEDTEFLSRESNEIRRIWVKHKLRRKINSLKIDLVNSHLFETDYFISTSVNLPHVISMHGSYEMYYHNRDVYVKDSYYGSCDFDELLTRIFKKSNYIITAAQKNEETIFLHPKAPPHEMIYYGKQLYLKDELLPKYNDAEKIGYLPEQITWCQENESYIWRYFIEKELSYSTDSKLPNRFTNMAPFSKFYLEIDNESPGRVGQWIGWQIVRSFMQNNKVSMQEMIKMDAKELFEKSKYKPKKTDE